MAVPRGDQEPLPLKVAPIQPSVTAAFHLQSRRDSDCQMWEIRLTYWNRCYGREQQFAMIKYNMGFDWISFIWTTPGRLTHSALTSSVTICSASHFVSRNSIAAQKKTNFSCSHYDDVIMIALASQITSLTVVYSIVNSGVDERKHQSSASLAFVRGIHRDRWIPRPKGQLRGKCLHLMTSSCGGREHQISTSADTLCNFG